MLFSRVLSIIAFTLSVGTLAASKPVAARGDISTVSGIFTTLQSNTNNILPQIKSLAAQGNATNDSVGPLAIQLTVALEEAKESLSLIGPISSDASNETVAVLASEIIENIAVTLDVLTNSTAIVDLSGLVSGIDLALAEVVLGLDLILAGVVSLIEGLLSSLVASLQAISFVQTLTVLNL